MKFACAPTAITPWSRFLLFKPHAAFLVTAAKDAIGSIFNLCVTNEPAIGIDSD